MKWENLLPLIVGLAVIYLAIRFLRPALRKHRHKVWEEAGLMPHQIDPHNPANRPDADDEEGQDQPPRD